MQLSTFLLIILYILYLFVYESFVRILLKLHSFLTLCLSFREIDGFVLVKFMVLRWFDSWLHMGVICTNIHLYHFVSGRKAFRVEMKCCLGENEI